MFLWWLKLNPQCGVCKRLQLYSSVGDAGGPLVKMAMCVCAWCCGGSTSKMARLIIARALRGDPSVKERTHLVLVCRALVLYFRLVEWMYVYVGWLQSPVRDGQVCMGACSLGLLKLRSAHY